MVIEKIKISDFKKRLKEGHEHLLEANKVFIEVYNMIMEYEQESKKEGLNTSFTLNK